MRSHLSDFKKHRAARIDHYVVEVNKLIIRLEKVNFVVLRHLFLQILVFWGGGYFIFPMLYTLYITDAGRETPLEWC